MHPAFCISTGAVVMRVGVIGRCLLPISTAAVVTRGCHWQLPVAYKHSGCGYIGRPLPITRFPYIHCPWSISHCPVPIFHSPFCPVPIFHFPLVHCPLPIGHSPLAIGHFTVPTHPHTHSHHSAFPIFHFPFPIPTIPTIPTICTQHHPQPSARLGR